MPDEPRTAARESLPAVLWPGLPFTADSTDRVVAEALAGRGIAWKSSYREVEESAVVGDDPRAITFGNLPNGDRLVNFCSTDGGFRALRLSSLRRVGAKGRATRARRVG